MIACVRDTETPLRDVVGSFVLFTKAEAKARFPDRLDKVGLILGQRAAIEAAAYLALGVQDYPRALSQRVAALLNRSAHKYPDDLIKELRVRVARLTTCALAAEEGLLQVKHLDLSLVSSLTAEAKHSIGAVMQYVLDDERYLRELTLLGFTFSSALESFAYHLNIVNDIVTDSLAFRCKGRGRQDPLVAPSSTKAMAEEVIDGFLRLRTRFTPRQLERGVDHQVLAVTIKKKQLVELDAVQMIADRYLDS